MPGIMRRPKGIYKRDKTNTVDYLQRNDKDYHETSR